jgi:hypothetical protein
MQSPPLVTTTTFIVRHGIKMAEMREEPFGRGVMMRDVRRFGVLFYFLTPYPSG